MRLRREDSIITSKASSLPATCQTQPEGRTSLPTVCPPVRVLPSAFARRPERFIHCIPQPFHGRNPSEDDKPFRDGLTRLYQSLLKFPVVGSPNPSLLDAEDQSHFSPSRVRALSRVSAHPMPHSSSDPSLPSRRPTHPPHPLNRPLPVATRIPHRPGPILYTIAGLPPRYPPPYLSTPTYSRPRVPHRPETLP